MDDASYETWSAATSLNLLDKFREAEDKALSKMLGWDIRGQTPPPNASVTVYNLLIGAVQDLQNSPANAPQFAGAQ